MYNDSASFEWDIQKNHENNRKHGISFEDAQEVFFDKRRVVLVDDQHSDDERRLYCIGKTPKGIITVRYTMRGEIVRIFGAGLWRKGKKLYESRRDH